MFQSLTYADLEVLQEFPKETLYVVNEQAYKLLSRSTNNHIELVTFIRGRFYTSLEKVVTDNLVIIDQKYFNRYCKENKLTIEHFNSYNQVSLEDLV